jgi:ferredoxin
LKVKQNAYVFSAATYGGIAGSALRQTQQELRKNGIKLSIGFLVKMPGNYTPLYGAIEQEKQKELFVQEKQKIKEIARIIKKSECKVAEVRSLFIKLLFSGVFYKLFISNCKKADKKFFADEKCNGCGICEKVCPVQNIVMQNNRPKWLHNCEQCVGCFQWCPQEAIQFGKNTKGRKRYRHPEVDLKDILQR